MDVATNAATNVCEQGTKDRAELDHRHRMVVLDSSHSIHLPTCVYNPRPNLASQATLTKL
eukprot:m.128317 g.128317  ORF g.128317 m.128317 type:complete len:60 (-) comp11233_c1_seq2:77-256(-)